MKLDAQPVEPIQVEWNGKWYWKYKSADQHNNTPFKFNYQYDSTGQYLGWIYEFTREGDWINFYQEDSTKVASIFHIKDSLLNGKSTQFYLSGKKQSEYDFYNREKNGYVRYWSEEGVLTLEHQFEYIDYGHLQSSLRVGKWRDWDDQGNLLKISHFKDNELHGRQVIFYENGQVKVEEFYKNGERDSIMNEYHANGQLFRQLKYRDGEFIEDHPNLEYHPNGQIRGKGNMKQGRKDGIWKYFYKDGANESEGIYGTYVYQHEHGDLFFYHKRGVWKYWFPNGKRKAIGSYDDQLIQDGVVENHPNIGLGIKKEGWKYFNEQGQEIEEAEFIAKGWKINDY